MTSTRDRRARSSVEPDSSKERRSPEGHVRRRQDGLGKRYAFKLGAGIVGWPLNFGVQLLVTRTLGPAGYGSYSYLTGIFSSLIGFFDAGSSAGFYAKLCARPTEGGLKLFYWRSALVLGGGLLAFLAVALWLGWGGRFWPGEPASWVFLALLWAIVTWYAGIAEKIVDAHGFTARGEPMRIVARMAGLLAIGLLFLLGHLTFAAVLLSQIGLLTLQMWLWHRVLRRENEGLAARRAFMPGEVRRYAGELWAYSHPIALYMLVSSGGVLCDRWLLQYYAGGAQQGYYGIAYQVGAACFLFSSAMVPLLAREFAEAHQDCDEERMRAAFRLQMPRFYSLAAIGAVFMATQADRIAIAVGGSKFAHAAVPMALMCLYPIHQTYGQLSGSVFFATGKTRLYSNIGLFTTLLGVIGSYLLLAPRARGGLGLGSSGLAYKMVIVQLISINIQLWFNCRFLRLSFGWFLGHQCLVLLVLGALAGMARVASMWLTGGLISLAGSALVYLILTISVVWVAPRLFGTSSDQLTQVRNAAMKLLFRRSVLPAG